MGFDWNFVLEIMPELLKGLKTTEQSKLRSTTRYKNKGDNRIRMYSNKTKTKEIRIMYMNLNRIYSKESLQIILKEEQS